MTNKGFTLIEIIVVLIILGALATIALPSYFSWVERSKAAEAFASISSIKSQLVPCLRSKSTGAETIACFPSGSACTSTFMYIDSQTGTSYPGPIDHCYNWVNPASPNFNYMASNYGFISSGGELEYILDSQAWTITAYKGDPADGNFITLSGSGDDNRSGCYASGIFKGVCS